MFVQIVKFKLKPDASRELFIHLTESMISWLKTRKGFVAYELYEGTEFWFDRIVWEGKEYAEAGLKDFLSTTLAKQIVGVVEDGYSSFMGQVVAAA